MFDVLSTLSSVGAAFGTLGAPVAVASLAAPRSAAFSRTSSAHSSTRVATRAVDATRPILLLHGFGSSPEVMLPLARRIETKLGRRAVLVRTSAGREDIRDCAAEVAAVLDELAQTPGFEFADVVGHSMGGLVATWLLKKLDGGRHVRRVVTLGSPHRGAPLAAAGSLLLAGRSCAMRQMVPGSEFLRELEWAAVPACSQLLSIAGDADNLVPTRFARVTPMQRQTNLVIAGVAHLRLIFSIATLRALCEALHAVECGLEAASEGVALEAASERVAATPVERRARRREALPKRIAQGRRLAA